MAAYSIDVSGFSAQSEQQFAIVQQEFAQNRQGSELKFNSYYMSFDNQPFFAVSGEFHFSRMNRIRWNAELAKVRESGVNIISTYVFWNHHEEHKGEWNFSENRNLREFIQLCGENHLFVILRLGPFNHGEVRNGGLPDWLFAEPYEVRSLNQQFVSKVTELYSHIAQETQGLYFKDGGPIIAAQLDNEYMHSGAPWEITTGVSNEWVTIGEDGVAYLEVLRSIAEQVGIDVPFFTCTGWGGAATLESALPLWGGYAYRPWLFYKETGEHPLTTEYVYRNFHDNNCTRDEEFDPHYNPDNKPYACCEMGGGMTCSYNYRFTLPMKSVDAMANIKIGSGCNFLGYYMFHGGTNPLGDGVYLNEGQVPKVSYDYQAAIGEFGQERESYRRLKVLHSFIQAFEKELCPLAVALPQGQSDIAPSDKSALRWSVRTDGYRGFVFINNFQDHNAMNNRHDEEISISLNDGTKVLFDGIGLSNEENCILPFHLNLDGVDLIAATAQPITVLPASEKVSRRTFVFMKPEGMDSCWFNIAGVKRTTLQNDLAYEWFTAEQGNAQIDILVINRAMADAMFVLNETTIAFTRIDDALFREDGQWILESAQDKTALRVLDISNRNQELTALTFNQPEVISSFRVHTTQIGQNRFSLQCDGLMALQGDQSIADIRLRIAYQGDIGWLFCGSTLLNDNFSNDSIWEVGLREYLPMMRQAGNQLSLVITPKKQDAHVNVDSAMAARREDVGQEIANLINVEMVAVCRYPLDICVQEASL